MVWYRADKGGPTVTWFIGSEAECRASANDLWKNHKPFEVFLGCEVIRVVGVKRRG